MVPRFMSRNTLCTDIIQRHGVSIHFVVTYQHPAAFSIVHGTNLCSESSMMSLLKQESPRCRIEWNAICVLVRLR